MKVLYTRVSTIEQNSDRQKVNSNDYKLVIEDKCSGSIPFFERMGGKEVLKLVEKEAISELNVWQIDRLGRDVRDILNTIHFFNQKNICINFISQSLKTINPNGKEDVITKMIISILGIVSEMERNQIKERQLEGIQIAKLKGSYLGRKKGTKESISKFLSKPINQKVISYLKKGYKSKEISSILKIHMNTITKIKKGINSDFMEIN
jgi:DNA invertase Pin-like site-specific DNA recombinase